MNEPPNQRTAKKKSARGQVLNIIPLVIFYDSSSNELPINFEFIYLEFYTYLTKSIGYLFIMFQYVYTYMLTHTPTYSCVYIHRSKSVHYHTSINTVTIGKLWTWQSIIWRGYILIWYSHSVKENQQRMVVLLDVTGVLWISGHHLIMS